MTLSRAFTQTFDPVMKERGFQRKGVLYYRLNGEILQGIILNACNPFLIDCAIFPYWCYRLGRGDRGKIEYLKKGWWPYKSNAVNSHRYFFNRPDQDEAKLQEMQMCLALVRDHMLPALDALQTEQEYYEMWYLNRLLWDKVQYRDANLLKGKFDFPELWKCFLSPIDHLVLWIAHEEENFASVWKCVDKWAIKESAWNPNPEEYKELLIEDNLSLFCEKMEQNDLNWIVDVREQERQIMKEALKQELKLIVP